MAETNSASSEMTVSEARQKLPCFVKAAHDAFEMLWQTGKLTPAQCLAAAQQQARLEAAAISIRLRLIQQADRKGHARP